MDLAYVNPKDSSGLKNYQSILTIFLNKVRYLNTPKTGHLHVNQHPKLCTRHLKYEPFQIYPCTSSIHVSSSSAIFHPNNLGK